MPASLGAEDASFFVEDKPVVGEDVLEVYRAGVIVSSEEIEGVAPCEAPFCPATACDGSGSVLSGALYVIEGRIAVTIVVLLTH
jgi:hypothetical protein